LENQNATATSKDSLPDIPTLHIQKVAAR
jgi:hypothetical protein